MTDIFEKSGFIYYDGGFGSMLIAAGKKPDESAEVMNIEQPETVEAIHRQYVEAGSDIIVTNSFGACSDNLEGCGYTVEEVVLAAVRNAKNAAGDKAKVALDIGPIGEFLEPYGELSEEHAYEMFSQQMIAGERAGADFIAIETMTAIEEMEIALKAARENTKLPVFATMTFDKNGYTMMGCTIEQLVEKAEEYGAAAVGINCSSEPAVMGGVIERLVAKAKIPTIVKLNAGKPDRIGKYSVSPEMYVQQLLPYAKSGIKIIGGCCGTNPDYIRAIKEKFETL